MPGTPPVDGLTPNRAPTLGAVLLAAAFVVIVAVGMPEVGLAAGVALALLGVVRTGPFAERCSRSLIQACVVVLGLRMDLSVVAQSGLAGLAFAVGTIIATLGAGFVLGRQLNVGGRLTLLLSSGTAICGGSAIAAVGSVIHATRAQISVATGVVFLLNAAALYLFPPLGRALDLSAHQFGAWAGIAIHDISSVVSAGAAFDRLADTGGQAAQTATLVKLTRVIWIIPLCFASAALLRTTRRARPADRPMPIPWFIGLFVLAAAARSLFPREIEPIAPALLGIARRGMAGALFLVGTGLTWRSLRLVGARPLILGASLWLILSVPALLIVRATVK